MNETDVKELFASAVAHPSVDRIDTDAVLRGGRRRHRARLAGTVGTVVAVVAVAATVLFTASSQPSPLSPGAISSIPGAIATRSVAVTDAAQIAGSWVASTVQGRDVRGHLVHDNLPLAVTFGAQGTAPKWELNGWCAQDVGTFTVSSDGRFSAQYTGPVLLDSCLTKKDLVEQAAIDAITAAHSATLTRTEGQPSRLTMRDAKGTVLVEWLSQVVAPVSPMTANGTCSGVAIDVAPGVKGSSSPQAAIDTFVRSGSTSLSLPRSGWVSDSPGQYTSGTAVIEMNRLPDGGYVVTGAHTC